jgi:hypothetical protein
VRLTSVFAGVGWPHDFAQEASMNNHEGNAFEMRTESRLATLEAQVAMLIDLARESREQIMKIRTTDFRILLGLIISSNLGIIALIFKVFAP